jgi:hypothetical protein
VAAGGPWSFGTSADADRDYRSLLVAEGVFPPRTAGRSEPKSVGSTTPDLRPLRSAETEAGAGTAVETNPPSVKEGPEMRGGKLGQPLWVRNCRARAWSKWDKLPSSRQTSASSCASTSWRSLSEEIPMVKRVRATDAACVEVR